MEKIGEYLKENASTIAEQTLTDWNRLSENEPWHKLPDDLEMDHLPELIGCLADASLVTFFSSRECAALANYAAQHGEHRCGEGVPEEVLRREYEVLRWGVWKRLKQAAPPNGASQAIIRLDSAMTFALGATLRGYHRHTIEETSDWPGALERYIDEWSFPDE